MTLVYTDNGSCCINDAAVETIVFLREEKVVRIYPLHADMGPGIPFRSITDVQQVVYNTQAEPYALNDSCKEILELRKWKRYADRMRAVHLRIEAKNPDLFQEVVEEVKKDCPKLFDDEQADESNPDSKSAR